MPDYTQLNAVPEDVLSPYTFIGKSGEKEVGKMVPNGHKNYILSPGESMNIPKGYHLGTGYIDTVPLLDVTKTNITADKIVSPETVWSNGILVTGSIINRPINVDAVNAWLSGQDIYIGIPAGAYRQSATTCNVKTSGSTIRSIANIDLAYIASGQTVLGGNGTYTNTATATAADIRSSKTAYAKGSKLTGTMSVPTLF